MALRVLVVRAPTADDVRERLAGGDGLRLLGCWCSNGPAGCVPLAALCPDERCRSAGAQERPLESQAAASTDTRASRAERLEGEPGKWLEIRVAAGGPTPDVPSSDGPGRPEIRAGPLIWGYAGVNFFVGWPTKWVGIAPAGYAG
jgi:hypothetical protein